MRARRNEAGYPPADAPELTPDDVKEDLSKAEQIVDLADQLLDQMSPF